MDHLVRDIAFERNLTTIERPGRHEKAVCIALESVAARVPQFWLLMGTFFGLRNVDAFSSSSERPEGSPEFFGSGYTDANGAYWQEINLQALSQQPQFLSIGA